MTQTQVVELITAGRSGDLGLSPAESIRSGRMSAQTDEIVDSDEPGESASRPRDWPR